MLMFTRKFYNAQLPWLEKRLNNGGVSYYVIHWTVNLLTRFDYQALKTTLTRLKITYCHCVYIFAAATCGSL